jgi:GT2 family glycosyltransferase
MDMSSKLKKIVSPSSYRRLYQYVRREGVHHLLHKVYYGLREGDRVADRYPEWFERHRVTEEEFSRQRQDTFSFQPLISILVPTFNTPEEYLREMIDSVRNQSYAKWELCIADGSTNPETRRILKEYRSQDSRIKVKWLTENYGIADNTNEALSIASGDFIGLLDHDDLVEPDILYEVVKALQDSQVDIVYTDEDKYIQTRQKRKMVWGVTDPNLKPDFSIDLFRSHNYITHFFTVRAEIMKGVGGFRKEYDGSQDYDLMFRCIEEVWKRKTKIAHVAKPLYHWRIHAASTAGNPQSKMYCYEAGRRAIADHLERQGIKASVEQLDLWGLYHVTYEPVGNPLLSIIIPNKDHRDDLLKCIKSIREKSTYQNIELIIVENNSEEPETFECYKKLEQDYSNLKVVYWKGSFNYAAINNFGAGFASGDYYLLLNNDTELISPDGIADMLGICMRKDVGIVGAKLLYADNTIQHAGIVLGFGGFAGHVFSCVDDEGLGYMMRPRINCNYSAVTGACLMVKRSVFEEVQGLTEEFVVGLNDVDFCLKVRSKGYLVVYDAFAKWYHYESKSRGYDDTPEKKERLQGEAALFRKYWGDVLEAGDPFYNKNFPVTIAPFTLDDK